jgi:protein-S-isoprenylcysteine O-methyltransferase Ste14
MAQRAPGSPIPPPLVFAIATLGAIAGGRLLGVPPDWSIAVRAVGIAPLLAGTLLLALALGGFRRARTRPEPWKEPSALVTGGIYAVTRNPMYLGMLLSAVGIALLAASWPGLLGAATAALFIDRVQIPREERAMAALFAENWAAYCLRVRRWI